MNLALHTSHRLSIHTPVFWQGDHHDYQSFRLLLLHTTKAVAAIWYHNDFLTHYIDIANDLTLSALSLSSSLLTILAALMQMEWNLYLVP